MEIENELKELLLSAFKAGCAYVQHPNGDAPDFDEWLSNSLALGKINNKLHKRDERWTF